MRLSRLCLAGLLFGAGPLSAATSGPGESASPPAGKPLKNPPAEAAGKPADADRLIADLSSPDYKTREAASERLWHLGDSVLEPLKAAAAGDDPEAAFRASQLIRNIEHFVKPDTDPRVIELVERYMKANRQDRPDILRAIVKLRGWHQILKLHSSETDPMVLEEVKGLAHFAAVVGAREKILENKPDEAREYLELAPRDPQSLTSLAAFYRSIGKLDEEIEKAKDGPADWRAALARAKGDSVTAATAARESGNEELSAAMSLFHGDAIPWLDYQKTKNGNDPVRALYLAILSDFWSGKEKEITSNTLAPVLRLIVDARDEDTRIAAANVLFLLGDPSLGEATLLKSSPTEAAVYYSSLERIADALSALGLDPGSPDYNGWVAKRFEIHLNEKRDENEQAQEEAARALEELLLLAGIMDQFGLYSELTSAFEKPVLALAATDADAFISFFNRLLNSDRGGRVSVTLARNLAVKWAGDDDADWRMIIGTAFDEEELAMEWWDWMPQLDPTVSPAKRFDGLLALLQYGSDPEKLRPHWLDLAWKAHEKAGAAQKARIVKRIAFSADISRLGDRTGDAETAMKARDLTDPADRNDQTPAPNFIGLTVLELSATNRWKEAAEIFKKALSQDDEDDPTSMFYLHSYIASSLRRAGLEKEAAEHDALVEKLALGDWFTCSRNAQGYAFGGDYERSAVWAARAAIEAPPYLESYESYLIQYSGLLLEQGRWKESAALAEAFALRNSGIGSSDRGPADFLGYRLRAELPFALSLLETDRPRALSLIARCHRLFPSGGLLSDYFFPALRQAGLKTEHDAYFATSWKIYSGLCKSYPLSHRLHNGTAWLASRACRKLDEAEAHSTEALKLAGPGQPAYLDTMAEVHFARHDRKAAVKWSARAVNFAPFEPGEPVIRRQYERFSSDPFPVD